MQEYVKIKKGQIFLIILLSVVLAMGGSFLITRTMLSDKTSDAQVEEPEDNITTEDEQGDGYVLKGADENTKSIKQIVKENKNAVVEITTEQVSQDEWLQEYVTQGAGSGVIIKEDGYIMTNHHVIDGARKINVRLANGKDYKAELVGSDELTDIAVLKIDAKDLTTVTNGNSKNLTVGERVVAIGNPLGKLGGTVTSGIISALDRQITLSGTRMTLLQTDATINPGNSGGGLFNESGQLVGIVIAKEGGSNVEGLGFAVPVNTAADVGAQLMKDGKVKRRMAYSGMKYQVDFLNGITIVDVMGKNAKAAGFKPGDVLIAIDETQFSDLDELRKFISGSKPGDVVTFTILRNGSGEMNIKLKLEEMPKSLEGQDN